MTDGYVLVTIAYNEEERIREVLDSVIRQQVRPVLWVIISDGSTDSTDDLVRKAAAEHPFIRFFRQEKKRNETGRLDMVTSAKSRGWATALTILKNVPHEYLGNLDADVIFGPEYYREVLLRMEAHPAVGLGGGGCYNLGEDGQPSGDGFIKPYFVGGPVQFFRRRCFEEIGGYSSSGHDDVVAVAKARMKGWEVRCWPEVKAYHYSDTFPRMRDKIAVCFRMGQMDYIMGGTLGFQIARTIDGILRPPFLPGPAFLVGWIRAWLDRRPIALTPDLVRYMRWEQRRKFLARLSGRPFTG